MPRSNPTPFDQIALKIPCPICGAGPGVWCTTARDRPADWLHGRRTEPVMEAVALGRQEFQHVVADALLSSDAWDAAWLQELPARHVRDHDGCGITLPTPQETRA